MTETISPGKKLRQATAANNPLQVVGAINAYSAIMAQKSGHQALPMPAACRCWSTLTWAGVVRSISRAVCAR